jgi:outer membrane protein assembly factor BamB
VNCNLFFLALAAATSVHGAGRPGTLLWSFDTGSTIVSSPALANDGTLYVGNYSGLCAITNDGLSASNKWTITLARSMASPAIGTDGTVYVAADNGNLYSISPNGSINWAYPTSGGSGAPAIGYNGTLYLEGSNYLYAVVPSGALAWKSAIDAQGRYGSPVVAPDGTIYICSSSGTLYAFDTDGTQKWSKPLEARDPSPALGADGTIYVGGGGLYAISPDGTQLWYNGTNNFFGFSPVLARNGNIYIKDFNTRKLDVLNSRGEVLWSATQDGAHTVPTVAALTASGTAYYCFSNTLAALSPQGTLEWAFTATPAYSSPANGSPTVGSEGTIYAVFGTKLYAIYGTNKLADSPWPMYRQNARHTGKIEKSSRQQPGKRADAHFKFERASAISSCYLPNEAANSGLVSRKISSRAWRSPVLRVA